MALDAQLVTGPNFQQLSIGSQLITPTGGTQGALQDSLGNLTSQATYFVTGTPAATNQVFFIATVPIRIVAMSEIHAVTSGGALTINLTKDTATNAPGAGLNIQTGSFNINTTANTLQNGILSAVAGRLLFAAGERIGVNYTGAIGTASGIVITVTYSLQ